MRITYDLLHKFARETVNTRKRTEPDLHAAYLIGSLLDEVPLLGGSTDIDLVFVHRYQAPVERETVAITPEVSLDIRHKVVDDFEPHRKLRQDPILGYPLTKNQILLYDNDHWLEFIQSGVSADFHRPENVLARVRAMLDEARTQWFDLLQSPPVDRSHWVQRYMTILALAANAANGLIAPPLTTRRFLIDFELGVTDLGAPKILAGFQGLLGRPEIGAEDLLTWAGALETAFLGLDPERTPTNLAPCRHAYYLDAIRWLATSEFSSATVWPLLKVWTDLRCLGCNESPEAWESLLSRLQLAPDQLETKTEALDAYLDNVEVVLESWANAYA
jgi:hypothetical protein